MTKQSSLAEEAEDNKFLNGTLGNVDEATSELEKVVNMISEKHEEYSQTQHGGSLSFSEEEYMEAKDIFKSISEITGTDLQLEFNNFDHIEQRTEQAIYDIKNLMNDSSTGNVSTKESEESIDKKQDKVSKNVDYDVILEELGKAITFMDQAEAEAKTTGGYPSYNEEEYTELQGITNNLSEISGIDIELEFNDYDDISGRYACFMQDLEDAMAE